MDHFGSGQGRRGIHVRLRNPLRQTLGPCLRRIVAAGATITALLLLCPGLEAYGAHAGIDTTLIDYSVPREYELGGIRVSGADVMQHQAIINRSGLVIGQRLHVPGEEVSRAVRKIWDMGLFSRVHIRMEKFINDAVFLEIIVSERPRLSKYTIQGLRKAEREEIHKKIQLRRGDPVTENEKSRIEQKVDQFLTDKGFYRNEVSVYVKADTSHPGSVILYVEVVKGARVRINSIQFDGNGNVHARHLKKAMKETKQRTFIDLNGRGDERNPLIKPGETFADLLGDLSVGRFSEYLDNRVSIRIFSTSKYIPDKLRSDRLKIIEYYNSKGYRDARILSDSMYFSDDRNINLVMNVEEGHRYYFRYITWNGNSKYPDALLGRILGIERGDIYDQTRMSSRLYMDQAGGDISSLYMDDGYLFFNVNPVEVLVADDSIDIDMRIYEGPQAMINQIIIKGNDRTKEHVIRRELRTLPGAKFSRTDLIRTHRELAALGYFDPEQLGIVPIPHPEDGTVDIEYTVVEKPSDQLELSAGYNPGFSQLEGATRSAGIYAKAGVAFNNFSANRILDGSAWTPVPTGDGQKLRIEFASSGRYWQQYTVDFTEPWLGGKRPNSFNAGVSYSLYNAAQKARTDSMASFFINRGFHVGYGRRLKFPDDYFSLMSTLSFLNYYLHDFGGFQSFSDGHALNISLKETLGRYSTTGNPQFPSGGSNVFLSVALTPPWSLLVPDLVEQQEGSSYQLLEYHKWRFTAEWYQRLIGNPDQGKRKLVLRVAAKFGFLGYYNKDIGITAFEQFQVGGDGLSNAGGFSQAILGYDQISLRGTRNPFVPVGAPVSGQDAGSTNSPIFNKITMEMRYPISLSAASVIYALAFLEGGNSYYRFKNYDPFDLRRSVGLGLRAHIPMIGMIGFDYGIGFDNPEDLGTSFGDKLRNGHFQFRLGFEPD